MSEIDDALVQRVSSACGLIEASSERMTAALGRIEESERGTRVAFQLLAKALCRQYGINARALLEDFDRLAESASSHEKPIPIAVMDVRAALANAVKDRG